MATKRRQQGSAGENGRSKQSLQGSNKHKTGRKRDKENGHTSHGSYRKTQDGSVAYLILVGAIALLCAVLHRNHLAGLFENDRHFSHLSSLERELGFRTEMGLYYSYYKTIITADSFSNGMHAIMYDNVTEYGKTINTLRRFNLYPEVVLAMGYRVYEKVMGILNIPTKVCWQVNRGEGLSPVQSCEGLGEPSYFYVENVFLLNGLSMGVFFLFGYYLSGSIVGGILAVLSFFYNHGECTRVQWTPPLRESFAYPFLVLEMFIVTYTIRHRSPNYKHSIFIALAVISFMLPWQFAQFALMTQIAALFATYVLTYIGAQKMKVILGGQLLGFFISFICLFGNEMLLSSFFFSCLVTVTVIVYLEPIIEKLRVRFLIWVVQGSLWILGTVGLKILAARLLQVADDAHIGDLLKTKFLNFANFHTMLYTCAPEFDFMERETPKRVLKTLLAPCVAVVTVVVISKLVKRELTRWQNSKAEWQPVNGGTEGTEEDSETADEEEMTDKSLRGKPDADVVFNLFQLAAFTLMAVIIMRLKLFWTPHMCLMTSILASRRFFGFIGDKTRHYAVLAAIVAGMSVQGIGNVRQQWGILGEFSNVPLEQVVEWINTNTPNNAVFAGPMPTMATVKLCTERPIVNHPHYEDTDLRLRTKMIYTMYSRKPAEEVWQNYMDLKVDYAILEDSWCSRRARPGCGMAEIWDLEDKVNEGKMPICAKFLQNPSPYFTRVYRNEVYHILKLNKSYKP